MELTYIYGTHAVQEALRKRPDVVSVVYVKEEFLRDEKFHAQARRAGSLHVFDEKSLPEAIPKDAVHQGMIAGIQVSKLMVPFKTFKQTLDPTPLTAVVVLGEVQDPHNVGAIIRSAAAFNIAAILIPEHRQAPVTGTVIKVSAGMAFNIPLISVGNVNTALKDLKNAGFWIYGLDSDGEVALSDEKFERPTVFVVGNEGKGMREKTKGSCDTILSIPMHPRAESLNASVSAAVVFYAWNTVHKNK